MESLVAAAQVITSRGAEVRRPANASLMQWQADSWGYHDEEGEFSFGVTWLSAGLSRVALVPARSPRIVGEVPERLVDPAEVVDDGGEAPEPLSRVEARTVELVEFIAGGPAGQAQLMEGFGRHLSVAGFCWMVAEPDPDDPDDDQYRTWSVYATDVLKSEKIGDETVYKVKTGSSSQAWRDLHPNALIVKCWRKHPARPWEPYAPVRSNLKILRQLSRLTSSITARATNQMSGRGLQLLPSELEFPRIAETEQTKVDEDDPDQDIEDDVGTLEDFMKVVRDYAIHPQSDPDSPAAASPLFAQIPGEFLEKVPPLIDFATKFDEKVEALINLAVRRLALGMDLPPEVLTGMGDMNHWNAWQVAESAINLHIRPPAQIVALALTDGYLIPTLRSEGFSEEDIASVLVWYDVTDLTVPPDRSQNAIEAYDRGELNGQGLRSELGLDESQAPDDDERRRVALMNAAKSLPSAAPGIFQVLGLLTPEEAQIVASYMGAGGGGGGGATEPPEDAPSPSEQRQPPEPPERQPDGSEARTAALLAACDGIVYRALERAGAKLRSEVGRKVHAGRSPVIDCDDPALIHTQIDATTYGNLDHLLDGAWARVPPVAARFGLNATALTECLDAYCRGLLAAGHPHDYDRLAFALGIERLHAA